MNTSAKITRRRALAASSALLSQRLLSASPSPSEATIELTIKSLRNTSGTLRVSLYDQAEGFPRDEETIHSKVEVSPIPKTDVVIRFEPVPLGRYAIALLHDEDDSGNMTWRFPKLPAEGFGFSNNLRPTFKAPGFDDASFLASAPLTTLTITPNY